MDLRPRADSLGNRRCLCGAWFVAIVFLFSDIVKVLAARPWLEDLIVAMAAVAVPVLAFFELRHSGEANRLRDEANEERRKANRLTEQNTQLSAELDAERNRHLAQIASGIDRVSQEAAASLKIYPCHSPKLRPTSFAAVILLRR